MFLSPWELPEIVWFRRIRIWNSEIEKFRIWLYFDQQLWCQPRANWSYWVKKSCKTRSFNELQFWIRLNLTILLSFYELKKVGQNVFNSQFFSEKQFSNYGRIDFIHHKIVKFRIFQVLSFIFESDEIRQFQGALMDSKSSVQTCFTVDLPLKNSILRWKTLIKVKGKS